MVASHIVFRYFTIVDLHGFGQEIGDEALLQQRVTLVFLVGQNRANVGKSLFCVFLFRFFVGVAA